MERDVIKTVLAGGRWNSDRGREGVWEWMLELGTGVRERPVGLLQQAELLRGERRICRLHCWLEV